MKYYSQFGQDRIVHELLNKSNGFFIEIGAYDGIVNSNTLFFEQLGWTGIAIEPNMSIFNTLTLNRRCQCLNIGISDKDGQMPYMEISGYCEQLSGLKSKYNYKHWERVNREAKEYKCKIKEISIPCLSFNSFISKYNISHCDFLSVDTEGSEIDIIKSIDWNNFYCKIICVENPYGFDFSTILPKYYKLCNRIECDDIYIREE